MNLPAALFPSLLLWLCNALALALLGLAFVRGGRPDPQRVNAWLAAVALTAALWSLQLTLRPGLGFHLLGAAAFSLLMGPWHAVLACALLLLVQGLAGQGEIPAFGLDLLIGGALPVGLTTVLRLACERCLPANLFVYIFLVAFLGGGLSLLAVNLAALLFLGLAGAYPWDELLGSVMPYYLLLSWSEAFTTGLVLSILVVYRPHWVSTFDDRRYLDRR
ncbi:energy-coupling factor ABC transporter permease [Paludibacterium yongneupense]|uniref:energy-coupling factor ABC transporter permease n=1 Tax=Paludibacterium yongneupense TaxID=400061 RepID=UPI00040D2618|nr:energy-coupling factor ABC transporter permease [Paludibacterium yongneupense]